MSTDEIDALLQRYLHLLDQYTTLRTELSTLQSSIHQDIARANFSADRGMRYGQDYYDSRMRASRLVQLSPSAEEPLTVKFTIHEAQGPAHSPESEEVKGEATGGKTRAAAAAAAAAAPNPINMFGILVPSPLRSAQTSAVALVENVVPRLVSTDAEMRELEIQIRRARKHLKRKQAQGPAKDMSALQAMAARDGPAPPGVVRDGPAPPYVEVRFAEEWE